MTVEQTPDRTLRDLQAMPFPQVCGDLRQRDVWRLINQTQNLLGVGLDAVSAEVPTLPQRLDAACTTPSVNPQNRRRCRNTKALGRRPARHAAINSLNQT